MVKKILINGITLDQAILVALLSKIRVWQYSGYEITIFGNKLLKNRIDALNIIQNYKYIELKKTRRINNVVYFMFEALKRNLLAISYLKKFKNRYDVIYSISSVLDLILLPYIVKKTDEKVKWVTVFDNTVPFNRPGNKFICCLAWLFFRISLLLLKKADKIFVISDELKKYLINKNFNKKKLIVTGNGIQGDLIKKAKKCDKYNIDALFVGRINEAKGIYDLLKVIEIIKKKFSNFQLAIMGDGDTNTIQKFKNKIDVMKLQNNIQFLGYKLGIEKFNIIKSSKCFIFLSHDESFGIALLEAVCCGIPCLAYDLEEYKEIYKKKEVIVFKKGDYQSIAKKIIEIFENKSFENKKGQLLLKRYNWEAITRIEMNAIETVCRIKNEII